MMKVVLSTTTDSDLYLFNVPFAVYSWRKLGVEPIIMWTYPDVQHMKRWELMSKYCGDYTGCYVEAPREKMPTYAQCARLYACTIEELDPQDILVTADADMCVFNRGFWDGLPAKQKVFHVIGSDLVPDGQFPMCYIMGAVKDWRAAMKVGDRRGQQCLNDLLGHIMADNFRGNYWCKDQEVAYEMLMNYAKNDDHGAPIWFHKRALPGTQLASQRADRDGWPDPIPVDIIDAHLPRPGNIPYHFNKIQRLFATLYPDDNLGWMEEYHHLYNSLA